MKNHIRIGAKIAEFAVSSWLEQYHIIRPLYLDFRVTNEQLSFTT